MLYEMSLNTKRSNHFVLNPSVQSVLCPKDYHQLNSNNDLIRKEINLSRHSLYSELISKG